MISSVDLAHCGVSRGKDWVSVDCGTNMYVVGTNQHAVDRFKVVIIINLEQKQKSA